MRSFLGALFFSELACGGGQLDLESRDSSFCGGETCQFEAAGCSSQKAGSDETYCGACKTFIEQVTMRAAKTRSKRTRGAKALEKVIGSTSDGSVQWCMSSNEGEDTRFMDLNEAMSGGSSGSLSMSPEVNDILSSCFAEFGQGRNGEVIEQALTEASNVYEAPIPNYGGGTLNEAFCSKVARACPVKSLFDEEEETDEYGFADDEL